MSTTVQRTDTDRVLIEVTDGYSVSAATASLILVLPDPVGLAEKLADALTDDERAGLREYLTPQDYYEDDDAYDTPVSAGGWSGPGTAGGLVCDCGHTVSWPDGTSSEDRDTMRRLFAEHEASCPDSLSTEPTSDATEAFSRCEAPSDLGCKCTRRWGHSGGHDCGVKTLDAHTWSAS